MPFGSAGDPNYLVLVASSAHPEPKIVVSIVWMIGICECAPRSIFEIVVDEVRRIGDCEIFKGDGITNPEMLLFEGMTVQEQDQTVDGAAYEGDGVGDTDPHNTNVKTQ